MRRGRKRRRRRTGFLRRDSPWPPRRRSPSWSLWEDRQQAGFLAERARETESLAQTVKSLKVRLDAIDAAKSREELSDLRQSVGDMKSTVVSARELNSALALISQRVDKLDNEESAKVDKLSERVDHEGSTLTAELATRVDKLEKKIVAPISAPTQLGQAGQPPVQPKFSANVSMETTASIERPKLLLRGYIVLDARNDVALIGGRFGQQEVRRGDFLPGAGRVERIELRGGRWTVLTFRRTDRFRRAAHDDSRRRMTAPFQGQIPAPGATLSISGRLCYQAGLRLSARGAIPGTDRAHDSTAHEFQL